MKLYVVLGSTPYEGQQFYAVRATREEAQADLDLLGRAGAWASGDPRARYAEIARRFGADAFASAEHEIREVEVAGVVTVKDAMELALRSATIAHQQVIDAWDRERDLRSVPG